MGKLVRNWNSGRWKGRQSKGGGVGIEDLHGLVAGGAEVRTVVDHEVGVRGHCQGILFHGRLQFKDVVVLDGDLEHGS